MWLIRLLALAMLVVITQGHTAEKGKHLFILSGQSNMDFLDPNSTFTPALAAEFGENNIIVVKKADFGKPIRRWYKQWKTKPKWFVPTFANDLYYSLVNRGKIYDALMEKVNAATKNQSIKTVTFVWMQGEKDAREENGDLYGESLNGLLKQLQNDLGRDDVNVVLGRITDYKLTYNPKAAVHWAIVRQAQVQFGEANSRRAWVNTDDLNEGEFFDGQSVYDNSEKHLSIHGYQLLGQRFASKSIQLIKQNAQ